MFYFTSEFDLSPSARFWEGRFFLVFNKKKQLAFLPYNSSKDCFSQQYSKKFSFNSLWAWNLGIEQKMIRFYLWNSFKMVLGSFWVHERGVMFFFIPWILGRSIDKILTKRWTKMWVSPYMVRIWPFFVLFFQNLKISFVFWFFFFFFWADNYLILGW